jgi:two-component system LytT family response regulator
VIFLDVQIYDGSGFDILEKLGDVNSSVVFTTAFDQYAIKAFKFSAIDYLLKPIDIHELKAAVKKVASTNDRSLGQEKIHNLLSNINQKDEPPVLLVSTNESTEFVRLGEILHCEAHGAYTMLHMLDTKPILVSRVIKEFEHLLKEYGFFRVHQSHIINLKEIRKYIKPDNCILMRDGTRIQVARSRKEEFFDAMKTLQL